MASSSTRISAKKKYGIACRNIRPGSTRSSVPPCRQPATMPSAVPIRKAMTVATPTRVMVHGRVWASSEETCAGYWETSVPKLKWKMSSRYDTY